MAKFSPNDWRSLKRELFRRDGKIQLAETSRGNRMLPARACIVITFLSLAGCAVNREIQVKSNPPVATVLREDTILGTTPFTTDINMLFPHRAYDFKPSASAVLIFKKEGYEDGSVTLTEFSVPPVVEITLVPRNAPAAPPSAKPELEERLRELERLRERGLINEDEYRKKREELLNEL